MTKLTARILAFLFGPRVVDCDACKGSGRVNHRCGMVCVDDPCLACSERGYLYCDAA